MALESAGSHMAQNMNMATAAATTEAKAVVPVAPSKFIVASSYFSNLSSPEPIRTKHPTTADVDFEPSQIALVAARLTIASRVNLVAVAAALLVVASRAKSVPVGAVPVVPVPLNLTE